MGTVAFPFANVTLSAAVNCLHGSPAEPETVGDRLRTRRLALGLSRGEVSERFGVSSLTLADWERGQRHPSYPH